VTRLRTPLAALLALALVLRLIAAWHPSMAHPDEVFQYLEQSHRLVFGNGFVPWEYRDGMRGWAVPVLLAAPMWLGGLVADTQLYLLLPRLLVAVSTLGIVWAAWSLGRRESPLHGLFAALVAAIWYEQVFYAAHTLTETMATAAALPAFALLLRAKHLPLAGALLAFAAVARFHYGPVLAFVVLWRTGRDVGAWRLLLLGAAPVLAVSAAADWAMHMPPFSWIEANVRRNVVDGAADTFGVSGPNFYLKALGAWWVWAFVPITFLAILGSRRQPVLLAAAIATILLHTAIGHKEARFILLASTLLVILAAFGTANVVQLFEPSQRRRAAIAAAGLWIAASLLIGLTGERRFRWSEQAGTMAAAWAAGQDPKLCGLATIDQQYWQFGGYAALHRNVPVYPLTPAEDFAKPRTVAEVRALAPSFNAVLVTPARHHVVPPEYRLVTCKIPRAPNATLGERWTRGMCLYRRAGGCDPGPARSWWLH
jgi:phosphatidylinositol glycan class B